MPEDIDKYIAIEKNKLSSESAWLWLLDIESDDFDTLHFVNNNENITYNSITYYKSNFSMDAYNKTDTSRLSELSITVANPAYGKSAQIEELFKQILNYIDDYDGLIGCTITRTPVNSKYLTIDMSAKSEEFIVTGCSAGEEGIVFTLGAPSPLNRRFPSDRYFGAYCRYVKNFKEIECGYSGSESTCNGTPEDCEDNKSNFARFGGQPGLRANTVRFAW